MKQYHIARDGVQYGPYTEEQITEMVAAGQLNVADLCWTEGMSQWRPLHAVDPWSASPAAAMPSLSAAAAEGAGDRWLLYIPVSRLIFGSLITFGLYEVYWMYMNWCYVRSRDGAKIMPFWRAIFGVFFVYSLLKAIKTDPDNNAVCRTRYSPGLLATGWIVLMVLGSAFARVEEPVVSLVGMVATAPTFLFLLPAQLYVNRATEMRLPGALYFPWTKGQVIIVGIGFLLVGVTLLAVLVDLE